LLELLGAGFEESVLGGLTLGLELGIIFVDGLFIDYYWIILDGSLFDGKPELIDDPGFEKEEFYIEDPIFPYVFICPDVFIWVWLEPENY